MRYTISDADIHDHKQDLLRIVSDNLGNRNEMWYTWKYLSCPLGPARSWLLRTEPDGTAVGCITLFPRKIVVDGTIFTVGVAGDFAVAPEHRRFWPALQLLNRMASSCFDECEYSALYTTPNANSEGMVLRSGYKVVGSMDKSMLLNRSEYKTGAFFPPAAASTLLAPVFNILYTLNPFVRLLSLPSSFTAELHTTVPADIEQLLQKSKPATGVAAYRTPEYLQWRFFAHPKKKYFLFTLRSSEGILACLAFYVENNAALVADIFYNNSHSAALLLSEFIRFSKREKYGSVALYYMGAELKQTIRDLGFLHVKTEKSIVALHQKSVEHPQMNENDWQFFWADSDV